MRKRGLEVPPIVLMRVMNNNNVYTSSPTLFKRFYRSLDMVSNSQREDCKNSSIE